MKFPTQGEVLLELSKGAVIMVEHINNPPSEERTVYKLSSNGRTIKVELFERMLKDELIKPNGDTLFGRSQTFSFRRSSDTVPDDAE